MPPDWPENSLFFEVKMIYYGRRFNLDASLVAPVIYGQQPHRVTNLGITISSDIRSELELLLAQYGKAIMAPRPAYYRFDCYFDATKLWVLEINTAFVDGWGTALILSRAANIHVNTEPLKVFPNAIATTDSVYLPEMQLFADELQAHMCQRLEIKNEFTGTHFPAPDVYVYGRLREEFPNIYPRRGHRLDDKRNLASFEHDVWRGSYVRIPRHFAIGWTTWNEIPDSAVLKFCEKGGVESERARASVILGKPSGKAKFLRFCYESERLIAQDRIQPILIDEGSFDKFGQLIILAIDDKVVCGYVQYSSQLIISDNSIHGPLLIE